MTQLAVVSNFDNIVYLFIVNADNYNQVQDHLRQSGYADAAENIELITTVNPNVFVDPIAFVHVFPTIDVKVEQLE